MGLDQYAYTRNTDYTNCVAQWRKHARLQEFMERLWVEKTGTPAQDFGGEGGLNNEFMELDEGDIEKLAQAIATDYSEYFCEGGFFYGHQFQEESVQENKENDLAFVEEAKKALADGEKVYYSCWW